MNFKDAFEKLNKIYEDTSFEKFVKDEADLIRQGKELSVVVEQIIKKYDILKFERFGKHEHHLIEILVASKEVADKLVVEINKKIKDSFPEFKIRVNKVQDNFNIVINCDIK